MKTLLGEDTTRQFLLSEGIRRKADLQGRENGHEPIILAIRSLTYRIHTT